MKNLLLTLAILTISLHSISQAVYDTTVLPLNDYLYTDPYPQVKTDKLDSITPEGFTNVMDYGAKGDGKTIDDAAIQKAFAAATKGVIFPSGKTFISSKLTSVTLSRPITVYAYGATIKKADNSRYSFLSVSTKYDFIWLGGTFDGNQENQQYPSSPTRDGDWVEASGQFVIVRGNTFGLFYRVHVINTVVNGILFQDPKLGVIAHCKGEGGADFRYKEVQRQGTYFKARGTSSGVTGAFYCINDTSLDGGIAIHYSINVKSPYEKSVMVINNCYTRNGRQNPIHIEDCKRNIIVNSTFERTVLNTNDGFHISNRTYSILFKNCTFRSIRLDFVNASLLKIGIIDSCNFSQNSGFRPGYYVYCTSKKPILKNSTFDGSCGVEQVDSKNVYNCKFTNFGNVAINGGYAINSCSFNNGNTPIKTVLGTFAYKTTFTNCKVTSYKTTPPSGNWEDVFKSNVIIKYQNL